MSHRDYASKLRNVDSIVRHSMAVLKDRYTKTSEVSFGPLNHLHVQEDTQLDELIIEQLQRITPEATFITEETYLSGSADICWYVDAIEGTSNFAAKVPIFATQLAVIIDNQLVASWIGLPLESCVYSATLGQGAYRDTNQIHCSAQSLLDKAVISVSKGRRQAALESWLSCIPLLAPSVRSIRALGATGYELALTAQGTYEGHINFHSNLYDILPGILLCHEAKCRIHGYSMDDPCTPTNTVVVSNPHIYDRLIEVSNI